MHQTDGEQPLQQRHRISKRVETRQLIREEGYDADDDNGWVSKIERQSTVFLWEGDRLLGEVSEGRYRWYLYEPDSFRPLLLIDDGQVYYYQLDHLGTPLSLTDSFGHVVWQASYSAFGEAQISIEQVRNPLRFQGQYFDDESGLHYNRYRYYDPHTGRYISQDPIGLLGGLNPYRYAPNPVNWVDPLGLTCKEEGFLARNQQDMQSYWDSIQDGAVDSQSPATYMGAGLMKSLGNIGYSIANSVTDAITSPGEGLKGVAKSVVNFGPELFNGAVNVTKKAADGFTLIAEQSGMFDQGAFQTFRDTEPYNIDLLAPYTNEAQQGGSLIAGVAGGAAAKLGVGQRALAADAAAAYKTVVPDKIRYVDLPNDLVADSKGVYGYLPTPDSQFHSSKWPVDWTDIEQVSSARTTRLEYHVGLEKKQEFVNNLRLEGVSDDDIARKIVEMRNQDRLSHYKTSEALEVVYQRNLEKYGNKTGPTYESQIAKYGTSAEVINAALRSNDTMDILTGIAKQK
ncbi:RHS repeat-associated core domain-containing protein [Pokkaliibacter plantistimulans]|uniref:RHS repeat-associated core domain-containing protein n=1 Tax=Pokkaliibacter plantistimulans TaxID=1635171 RepID=UPI000D74B23E|nr:RHS repeat-associated core domain-containing protein [Pokkaliibacter plantistimulans]